MESCKSWFESSTFLHFCLLFWLATIGLCCEALPVCYRTLLLASMAAGGSCSEKSLLASIGLCYEAVPVCYRALFVATMAAGVGRVDEDDALTAR